jgi:transketolase
VARGAYILADAGTDPDLVLIGTGSEVQHCVAASDQLAAEGIHARVVSMPSWELFEEQDDAYQESVIGDSIPVLAVEALSSFGWERWADDTVSLDRFGASAPWQVNMREFGFTAENVAARAKELLASFEGESS